MASKHKYNQAIWSTVPESVSPRESLQEDIEVDVAIIGAGITGITTAYYLKQTDKKIAVLESHKAGHGTTGSSTGNLYIPTGKFHEILKKHGQKELKNVISARKEALEFIENTIVKHSIDCSFKRVPWYYFSSMEGNASNMVKKEFEAIKKAGVDADNDVPDNFPFPVTSFATVEMQSQFNPLQYVQKLAAVIEDENCSIYENTKVTDIKDGDPCILDTGKGTVKAKKVVQATHTPKGIYAVHAGMKVFREYAMAAKINNNLPSDGIYWYQDEKNMYSIRTYENEQGSFLIVLDDSHLVGHKKKTEASYDKVEKFLRSNFSVQDINYLWAAQNYRSADDIPYIGTSLLQTNIYIATGFSTDGLIWGAAAAKIISDLINNIENPLASTFNPNRCTPSASFSQFASENIHVIKHLVKNYLSKGDSIELQELNSGEAKVVKIKNKKHAAYRSEEGKLSIVSAICPHMGCVVQWNSAEKSWDCPCHGSRFSLDGEVLEGPAIKDL
ncbi:MAG: FAD-dependent oxidoreductase [Bacteroidota bacterium]